MSEKLVSTFVFERETKRTMRYQEENDPPAIGSLYIQKHALKALNNPSKIKVTVEEVK